LFTDFGARFVANASEYFPQSDTTTVTIEAGSLWLRAVSFRDGFYLEVASVHHPKQWAELGTIVDAIKLGHLLDTGTNPRLPTYFPLHEIAKILKQHWQELQRGLSEEYFALTQQMVRRIKEAEMHEYNETMYKNIEFHRQNPHASPGRRG
jgi:hypothetical protein